MNSHKFCNQCGSPVTEESKFCSSCGSVIKSQQPVNIFKKISNFFTEDDNNKDISSDLIIRGNDHFGRYQLAAIIRDLCIGRIQWTENMRYAGNILLDRKEINELESRVNSFVIDLDFIKLKQDRTLLLNLLKEWYEISELSVEVLSNVVNDGYVNRIQEKIDKILENIKAAYLQCFLMDKSQEEIEEDSEYTAFLIVSEEYQNTLSQTWLQNLFNLGGFKLNEQEQIILKIIIFSFCETIFNEMILNYEDKKSDFFIKEIKSLSDGYNKYFSEENRKRTRTDILMRGELNVLLLKFNSKLLLIKIDENIW